MLYLPKNLKKYRLLKNLTQEDIAQYLGITAQSNYARNIMFFISEKWKRR